MNEKTLQMAAKWLWERKDNAQYWNYSVLTDENPDKETLHLNQNDAFQIFIILKDRKLILPTTVKLKVGNKIVIFDAFNINYNLENEWKVLVTKKGVRSLYIFPSIKFIFKKFWAIFLFIIILVFSSSINSYIQIIFDKLFKGQT